MADSPPSPSAASGLTRIRVVLVRPRHPGNVGAAARALKTMGLAQLWLVKPERFPDPEARIRAAEAADLLDRVRVVDTLEAALADCALTIATSARKRGQDWPCLSPREAAERLWHHAATADAALVFGPEDSGLTSDELYRCQFRSAIPTSDACRSLNLSHAVQVYAFAIRSQIDTGPPAAAPAAATSVDREHLYRHLKKVLEALDFPRRDPDHLLLKFRALGNRAELSAAEVSMLRGLLRRIEQRIAPARATAESEEG